MAWKYYTPGLGFSSPEVDFTFWYILTSPLNKQFLQSVYTFIVYFCNVWLEMWISFLFMIRQYVTGWDRSHGLPALSHVWQHVKLSDALCVAARPRYSLVVDEDVKKPTNQPNKQTKDRAIPGLKHDSFRMVFNCVVALRPQMYMINITVLTKIALNSYVNFPHFMKIKGVNKHIPVTCDSIVFYARKQRPFA